MSARVHPVFHVSLLKRCTVEPTSDQAKFPSDLEIADIPELTPLQVLDRRTVKRGQHGEREVLVQWSGLPEFEATWEAEAALHRSFPDFNLEDEVRAEEGNDVMYPKPAHQETAQQVTKLKSKTIKQISSAETNTKPRRSSKKPKYLEEYISLAVAGDHTESNSGNGSNKQKGEEWESKNQENETI